MKTEVTLTVTTSPEIARVILEVLHENGPIAETNPATEPADDEAPEYDPADRIFGEKGEKARRTKDEMAQDEAIEERWKALWPSKAVPAKPVAELEAHLDKVEGEEEEVAEDEGGFVVDEDTLDLEEFRAIIVKHSKALGGKKLGEIMAPHKNPAQVPEDQRREYANTIELAAKEASDE